MDNLFQKQERLLQLTSMEIIRPMMQTINWDNRLISLRGARGVGKSYLLRQYVKLHYPDGTREALYCSADNLYFSTHTLIGLAEEFYLHGGKTLIIDEIHRYKQWSQEIKEIYDFLPGLNVVISGSSLIDILRADVDLSRRCLPYNMPGLSFREFLAFYKGIELKSATLEEILCNPYEITSEVNAISRPLPLWKEYLRAGYYPFYDGNQEDYQTRLENVVNYIVDYELPHLCDVDLANSRKIKAMLCVLAENVPFDLDIAKMSVKLQMSRSTVLAYLLHLAKASLLHLLYADNASVTKMQKPDKIYLQNPNLLYALAPREPKIGTIRETFAVSQLGEAHTVEYGRAKGDFLVDGKWTFEIGGADKDFSQIAEVPDSYVFADNIEYSSGRKIPLWLLGFLY